MTSDGKRMIKDINVNDKVLSYKNGKVDVKKVTRKFERVVDRGEILKIQVEGKGNENVLFCTRNHRFYTNKGWKEAHELEFGDEIYYLNGTTWYMKNNNPRKYLNGEKWQEAIRKLTGLKRSKKTRQKIREAKLKNPTRNFGEKNGNWKGGIEQSKYTHHNKQWLELRKIVLERDNHTCLICGAKRDLVVHHIDFDTSNNVETNLCVLCRKCNSKINHGRFEFKPKLRNGKKVVLVSPVTVRQAARFNGDSEKIKVYNLEVEDYNTYFAKNLLVHNCDTQYHTTVKYEMSAKELSAEIKKSKADIVCWTGGEPLLYYDVIEKVTESGFATHHVETNGDLLKDKMFDIFHYMAISPKELKIAKKTKKFAKDKYLNEEEYDIKVVTDLKKEGMDMLSYATMLMPLTTYNAKKDLAIQRKVWNYCVEHKLRFTSRFQVWIWGKKKTI